MNDELKNAINSVIRTDEGKKVFIHILKNAGIYDSSYSDSDRDTNFREGRRSIGLDILSDIANADQNNYYNILRFLENGR